MSAPKGHSAHIALAEYSSSKTLKDEISGYSEALKQTNFGRTLWCDLSRTRLRMLLRCALLVAQISLAGASEATGAQAPQSDECWYAEFDHDQSCHAWCDANWESGSFCVNNACGEDACCCTAEDCPGATANDECLQQPRDGWGGMDATSIIIIVAIAASVCFPAVLFIWWCRQPESVRTEMWNRRLRAVGLAPAQGVAKDGQPPRQVCTC